MTLRRPAIVFTLLWLSIATLLTRADEPRVVWKQTGNWPAAEAHQAAAADDKFVYAITNTLVAKYDRQSGERFETSIGEAKHLNSGFLWERRLYCAHSNYPQTPEKSESKVGGLIRPK